MTNDHDHHHTHVENGDLSRIQVAFALNFGFALLELFFGWLTNSMAIFSDALHDLGDSTSLGLAWVLAKISGKKKDDRYSYGYQRFSLMGAFINAVILFTGSVLILIESIPRIIHPEAVRADWMIVIAVVGIVVNGTASLRMKDGKTQNAKVVSLHLLEDVIGWAAVLVVSILMLFWDWKILDPLLSVGISIWVIVNVVKNIQQTIRYFLQGVPSDISVRELDEKIKVIPAVLDVHHTHIWSLDGDANVFTTHLVVDANCTHEDVCRIKQAIYAIAKGCNAAHSTIEVEFDGDECTMLLA